jgi:hypothetical protein
MTIKAAAVLFCHPEARRARLFLTPKSHGFLKIDQQNIY